MSGVVKTLFGSGGAEESAKAAGISKEMFKYIKNMDVPELQKLALENPELVGLLEAEQLGRSAYEDIELDPRLQAAQMSALEDISDVARTGLGAEDRLALEEIKRQAAGQAQAQRASTLQQMEARGLGDSGASLAAQLSAGQQAADTQAMQGMRQAAQAQQARMSALGQQSGMASQMQGQQLGLASQKAGASDAISQFNAQNRQNVAAQNLAAKQAIENQRAATRNQESIYNVTELPRSQFGMQMQKAGALTGQGQNLANMYAQQGLAQAQGQTGLWGSMIEGGARAYASDEKKKTNIEDYSSEEFLDKLKPYTYDYKNPERDGEGRQAGVMAQDLEKTEVGKQSVIDTDEGKMVDYNKLGPTMLASLVELNERLKKLEGK